MTATQASQTRSASAETSSRSFTLVRSLPAPRSTAFAAWTDPGRLHWFAGTRRDDGRDIDATVDLRPGGAWRLRLFQPDGVTYVTGGIYREIVRDERLVFAWGAVGGFPELDPERLDANPQITVEFHDGAAPGGPVGSGTELVVQVRFADVVTDDEVAAWLRIGMREGLSMTLDRLSQAL